MKLFPSHVDIKLTDMKDCSHSPLFKLASTYFFHFKKALVQFKHDFRFFFLKIEFYSKINVDAINGKLFSEAFLPENDEHGNQNSRTHQQIITKKAIYIKVSVSNFYLKSR